MESAVKDWSQSPLVKRAVALAGPGADTLDILDTLLEVMNDVEDRLPGVSFTDLFTSQVVESNREGRIRTGAALLASGLDEYEIDKMFGTRGAWVRTKAERGLEQFSKQPAIALLRQGLTYREISAQCGISIQRISQIATKARKHGLL